MPLDLDVQVQLVTWNHRLLEACLVDAGEEEVEQLRGYLIRICDNLDIDSSPGCKPESGAKKEKRE